MNILVRKGTLIDGTTPITFTFEGLSYTGFKGDTIASALAANGQWVLSRSFKYHRPRGILTMAGQDANTLVQVGNEVSVFADRHPISEGLSVKAQNVNGSVTNDRDFIMNRFGRFMPVGFYYRTFYRPKGIWEKLWEPMVRAKAGLGKLDITATDEAYHDKAYGWYDVVIVGGGPAGMAAALEAAKSDGSVLLVEENTTLGGALSYARFAEGCEEAQALIAQVKASHNIAVWTGATCNGWFSDNWLAVIRGNRLHKVRACQLVLATGLIEQPSQFRNNDLPGIMQGSAAQRLIKHYGVKPGQKAVVLAANDDAYGVALDLADAGVALTAICDLRKTDYEGPLRAEVEARGLIIRDGWCIYEALPAPKHMHVNGVTISELDDRGAASSKQLTVACDLVCISVGYTPTYQLAVQAGGKVGHDDATAMFSITGHSANVALAGSVDGRYDLSRCITHGRSIGVRTSAQLTDNETVEPPEKCSTSPNHSWPIFPHPKGKDFVDFDEDLQVKDIKNAMADGYRELELIKRFSTVGMGPSQGRHSALPTARLVAKHTNRTIADVGVTTARPPFTTEKVATLAGRKFTPMNRTPMHMQHENAEAQWLLAGNWQRPAYYGTGPDSRVIIADEVKNVRTNVGMIDVSTLGGLDVRGPDAAEFLNRMYTFTYAKLPIGKTRYLLMTNEAGTVVDDGVACRIAKDYFFTSATTTGVDDIYRNMLWWNAQWRLNVDIANVTSAYAGVNLAGPNARKVLDKLTDDIATGPEDFPYLAYREGFVAGIPSRTFRVGFIGELGYEIHVPSRYGAALWEAIAEAGVECGICPFGLEAQRIMRLEKGHVIVGQDTDGMTTPEELDMSWAVAKKKPFFIGKRSLELRRKSLSNRKLVGFTLDTMPCAGLEESNLVIRNDEIAGFITSICLSPSLGKVIGLAYAARSDSEVGSQITLRANDGSLHSATICAPHFYDPNNARQEM